VTFLIYLIILFSLWILLDNIIFIFRNQCSIERVVLMILFLLFLIFVLFVYVNIVLTEIQFTEESIKVKKGRTVIREIYWDDFNIARFKKGSRGNIIVTLSTNKDDIKKNIAYGSADMDSSYQFILGKWFITLGEGQQVIHYIEKKYGVIFRY